MPAVNTCTTTTLSGQTCTDCTGQVGIVAIAGHVEQRPRIGWDSGANSVSRLTGDLHVTFSPSVNVQDVIGLALDPRPIVVSPNNILFGWYLVTVGATIFAQPIASGHLLNTQTVVSASDTLEIKRVGGIVSALINGTLAYRFPTISIGKLCAACALFASGDAIP